MTVIGDQQYFPCALWCLDLFKGEGHSKKLTFLSPPKASKRSGFPFSPHLTSKEAQYSTLETVLGSHLGHVYGTSLRPTLAGRKKIWNWLCILHKVSKTYFFQAINHFTIFTAIIIGIWSMFESKQYGPGAV